jgi:hypothetical protein
VPCRAPESSTEIETSVRETFCTVTLQPRERTVVLTNDGAPLGCTVGWLDGNPLGRPVGDMEGWVLGWRVGHMDGWALGSRVG